jgi:hypothetical protein
LPLSFRKTPKIHQKMMQGYLERTDQVEAPEAVEEVEAMVVEEEEVAPSVLAEISEVFQRTGVQ